MNLVRLPDGSGMNVEITDDVLPMDTLFLHGNLASNAWWHPSRDVWRQNAGAGNSGRMLLAEWRGCGDSEAPESLAQLHPASLAEDAIAILHSLRVNKCCLVAHSTGGLIALFALMKAPELFDRVVLLDSVGATGVQFAPAMYDAFTQMSQDREFCATVMSGTIYQCDATSALFKLIVDDAYRVAPLIWHGIPKLLNDINITRDLALISTPVLVLHGEHDAVLPMADSRALTAGLKNSRFVELKNQGHSTNVENPRRFVQIVNEFLFPLSETTQKGLST